MDLVARLVDRHQRQRQYRAVFLDPAHRRVLGQQPQRPRDAVAAQVQCQRLAGIAAEAVAGSLETSPEAARRSLDVARQMLRYSEEEARRSVADRIGLQKGDLILRVDGKRVEDLEELRKRLVGKKKPPVIDALRQGAPVQLVYRIP